jgi:TRAP transporter T-component
VRWLAFLVLAACGASAPVVTRTVVRGGEAKAGHAEAVAEAEGHFAKRLDERELRLAIAAWRRAVTLRDDDAASYLMLSRALYFHVDGFLLVEGRKQEAEAELEEGFKAADRGLRARFPKYEQLRKAGGEVDQSALGLGKDAVPFLYWYAHNLIRWADLKGRFTAARVYERVFRLMEMVRTLDERFDHAGAVRFFGAARAEAPAIAGGSMSESRKFFERALWLEPDYLENHLQMAQHYAKNAEDEKLYRYHLEIARKGKAEAIPEAVPEQEIARKKAMKLADGI